MRQSELFTKARREAPADEVAKNAALLIRAGYIRKEMAGVYSYLPLGLRVLERIVGIIREEMNALGGEEVFLASLQNKAVWQKTGRWDEKIVDVWFKTRLADGGELGLGFSHEEPLTKLMADCISSYKDLPRYVYQFQTKFRNEARAKSGILRTREFLMKDLYSFSRNKEEHEAFYERAKDAYGRVFNRVGLGAATRVVFASGGSFAKHSHEFQTISPAGEDVIHVCAGCGQGINREIFGEYRAAGCPACGGKKFAEEKAIEVGNIFTLGTRFSEAFGLVYADEAGKETPVFMGSYGIGPGRVMGTIVELFADEKGLVWPESVAPFSVHLLSLAKGAHDEVARATDELYKNLLDKGIPVLYDDRDFRAGEKFAEADLLGIPHRAVVSERTLREKKVELKKRTETTAALVPFEALYGLSNGAGPGARLL